MQSTSAPASIRGGHALTVVARVDAGAHDQALGFVDVLERMFLVGLVVLA